MSAPMMIVRKMIEDEAFQRGYEEGAKAERERVRRIDYLRSLGWMVAVHNDYKQNGEFYTFWLLTHPDGRYFKGEGKTDDEALDQIAESLRSSSPSEQEGRK